MKVEAPKEPKSFKYPRMYARFDEFDRHWCRLIIINPDGTMEGYYSDCGEKRGPACYWSPGMDAKEVVKAMHKYTDELLFRNPAIFIGEIKMEDEQ